MEPMTLGSPVSSPISSPSFHQFPSSGVAQSNNPYYPSYLMGESQTNLSSLIPPGSISPGRRARQFSSTNAVPSPSSAQVGKEAFFPTTRIGSERQGGPPTLGLMGGLPQSPSSRLQSTPFVEHHKIIAGCGQTTNTIQSFSSFSSPLSSTQINQPVTPYTPTKEIFHRTCAELHIESQSVDPLEDTWVTVYGFPVASASYILTQFAQLGTIIDQRHPGLGNWMHLKYQTKLQARKALTKNSKIFNGNIMVGVVPCTDLTVTGDKENVSFDTSSIFSPKDTPKKGSVNTPKSLIRPLTQAYQASRADIEVTPSSNTPKKSDSLVSKAIQHILGV